MDLKVQECLLPAEEAKHVTRVLRKQLGDSLLLTDGKGHFVESRIISIEGKKCKVALEHIQKEKERGYQLNLAIAPTKNSNRYEWILEKATEIGVDAIIPLLSFHSERRNINQSRLEKILVSAMKQSQKARLPLLHAPVSFKDFIGDLPEGLVYIAHCNDDFPRKSINATYRRGESATLLIGPEGDFSKEEIQQAIDMGCISTHLGTSRLRTETAGIVACSTIYQLNYEEN